MTDEDLKLPVSQFQIFTAEQLGLQGLSITEHNSTRVTGKELKKAIGGKQGKGKG